MNAREAEAAVKELTYPSRTDYSSKEIWHAARRAYNEKVREIELKFREWLGNEYAASLPTQVWDKIWSKAWEHGHAYGYSDVENHYIDFAAFADEVADWYR
jgi:hypothetical protein